MNSVNKLNFTICNDNNSWFVLENESMGKDNFYRFVTSLEKAFVDSYGVQGALDHVKKVEKDDKLVMFVEQKKVPHVIKALINNNIIDVEINLLGMNSNKEYTNRIIKKPFIANDVTELIPFYNVNTQKNVAKKSM